jgi:predicted alpha/beta hydrolase
MRLASRLARLERAAADAAFKTFFRRWQAHESDPSVSAATDALLEHMAEVEAVLGRPIALPEWLDDDWMAGRGLEAAVDRLLRAVTASVC